MAPDHRAACHYAEEALKSDVGVAQEPVAEHERHGTPKAVTARVAADAETARVAAAATAEQAASVPAGDSIDEAGNGSSSGEENA